MINWAQLLHSHQPPTIVNHKTSYNLPSPGGRELKGGGIHPHLYPLPSRERNFIWNYAGYYKSHHILARICDESYRPHLRVVTR